MDINQELAYLTRIQRFHGEPDARFHLRLVSRLEGLDSPSIDAMSGQAYAWAKAAIDAAHRGRPLPSITDDFASSDVDQLYAMLVAEDAIDSDRMSSRKTFRQSHPATTRTRPWEARKAAQDFAMSLLLRNCHLSIKELMSEAARHGHPMTRRKADVLISGAMLVSQAIRTNGYRVIDENGDNIFL